MFRISEGPLSWPALVDSDEYEFGAQCSAHLSSTDDDDDTCARMVSRACIVIDHTRASPIINTLVLIVDVLSSTSTSASVFLIRSHASAHR